jgi:hypothetical protein
MSYFLTRKSNASILNFMFIPYTIPTALPSPAAAGAKLRFALSALLRNADVRFADAAAAGEGRAAGIVAQKT